MKRNKKIALMLLVVAFVFVLFTACSSKERKLYDEIYEYLHENYKGVEFQIMEYTQDIQTSGKYTFRVLCTTTNVEFEVIQSPLYVFDSFYVSHANNRLKNELYELLGEQAIEVICLDNVQYFDRYESKETSYHFKNDSELFASDIYDLKEIYRVSFDGIVSANDAAQCIYMFCDILEMKGISLNRVNFEFELNKETIRLVTNTRVIDALDSFEVLEELFEKTKSPSAVNNIFYKEPDSDVKIVPYPQ